MSDFAGKSALLLSIKEAAKARAEVPKSTLGYTVGMLAFSLILLREYEGKWAIIGVLAAISTPLLLIAVVSLVVRIAALKNIETLDARELFEGRIPDPEGEIFGVQLAMYKQHYQVSGKIGVPSLIAGASALAMTLISVVIYHLVV